jgi:hypothetical protein
MIKIGASHQHFAVLKPVERIGPEISRWVVVCVLNDAPKAPEIIAHRLVQHYPVIKSWYKVTTISALLQKKTGYHYLAVVGCTTGSIRPLGAHTIDEVLSLYPQWRCIL